MEWYHKLVSWIIKKRIHQIAFFKQYPIEVQKEIYQKLLLKGRNTSWGEKHSYSKLSSIQDFKDAVPIQRYETLLPYIDRVIKGEKNVLWPSETKWFAKSSGTTAGKSKFIPVTKEALEDCHYKGGKDLLSIYFNANENSKIFDGKSLIMGGSSKTNQYNASSYYGDLSAIIVENLPYWINFVQTPDKSIALLPDWEEKISKMARITSEQNVTNLSGVPSWNLILLQKVLAHTGASNISEVWPNLELYAHGGVNFAPYQNQFKNLIANNSVTYLETYNASEGFFGIQDQFNDKKEMLLMLDYGIFYEFLPLSEMKSEHPATLQLDEVKLHEGYALIITTNAGLWRYMIGDTIEFTCLNPFRIRITGRTKYYINVFGEEVIEDNTNKAIQKACKLTNSIISEYTVAPIFPDSMGKGGHEWIIEFSRLPENKDYFIAVLDHALMEVNSDYEAKRFKNLALQLPQVHFAKAGTFYNWQLKNGKVGGQNKVPRLSMKRDVIEEILNELLT